MPKKQAVLALLEIEDAIISKDFFCKVRKLSKRHAEYLLQSGLIPCERTGRKTRRYRIRRENVLNYLVQREKHPEKYRSLYIIICYGKPHSINTVPESILLYRHRAREWIHGLNKRLL